MGAIRHIEIELKGNLDLTCCGQDLEDFVCDTPENILESVLDYYNDNPEELCRRLKVKKVWYEMEVD
jgi:hypothetical protein